MENEKMLIMESDDQISKGPAKRTKKKVKAKAAKLKPKPKSKPKPEPERISPKEMMRRHLRLKSWAKRTALKMKDERDLNDELNRKYYKPTKAEMLLYGDVARMKLSDSGLAAPTPAPARGATFFGCNMFPLPR